MLVRFVVSKYGLELVAYESPEIPLNVDPDLLSGMLEAMESLGTELKKPIQEITFSNWVIYIRPYPEFTIRLILADPISKEQADEYFKDLYEKTLQLLPEIQGGRALPESQVKSNYFQYLKPLIREKTDENGPNVEDVSTNLTTGRPDINKIAMAGLGAVGKTSIRKLFLDHVSPTEAANTKPTLGMDISKKDMDFLEGYMAIYEFGGQTFLRAKFLSNKTLWVQTSALIYVVDIQKPEQYNESFEYLKEVWKLIGETHTKMPVLSIFLHKYDPSKRKEMAENLRLCLDTFNEFHNIATFHLTAIEDKSSNIALIKTIYQSLPGVILENMLNDEFIKEISTSLMPRFTPLVTDDNIEQDEDLKSEIHSSSVLFGRGYGNKMQRLWIKYLSEEGQNKENRDKNLIQIKKIEKELHVSINKDQFTPNLSKVVLGGVMSGISKSLQFKPPKIIEEDEKSLTWQIGLQ